MKRLVIGTAGHIDHGKTLLTQALTGVDTDRLPAEKAQGITIELGFAPLTLPGGVQASVVDVPGHEKFVKTMLAGAAGIDAALLVVAANEGVMPQTREHLDILKLLHIPAGLVALTKCDLVSPAQVEQVRAEVLQLVRGSFLEGAPVLPVSAVTGEGLDALRDALAQLAGAIRSRDAHRPMRLPLDRVFSPEGQGTVSTGTLTDGTIAVGDTVMIYPRQRAARVRALQTHGVPQEAVPAGSRVAAVLAGVGTEDLSRGCTLAAPDSMLVTDLMDVWVQITDGCTYKIKNSSQLHLYCGTQEGVCRLRLLDAEALSAGQSGYAQLKLTRPMAVRSRDRFILRFFSPMVTVGGGVILEGSARRRRRNHPAVLERLERLNSPDEAVSLLQRIEDHGCAAVTPDRLAGCCSYALEELAPLLAQLEQQAAVLALEDGMLLSARALDEKQRQVQTLLEQWQADYPLMTGMPLAQLRGQGFAAGEAVDPVLRLLADRGALQLGDGFASLPGFVPVFTQQHKIMQRKLLHYYRDAWFFAPDRKTVDEKFSSRGEIYPQVMRHMLYNRLLVPLSPRYAVHHEAYDQAVALLHQLTEQGKGVTLGEFRTSANISRKYAQLFLEHWDSVGLTRRAGDVHYRVREG